MTTFSALSEDLTQQIFFHLPFNDALALRRVDKKTNELFKATLTTIVGQQPHAKEGVFYSYLLSKYGLAEEDVEQLRHFLADAGIKLSCGRSTIGYLLRQNTPRRHLVKIKKHIQTTCLKYDEVTVDFCRQLRSSLIKLRRYDILRMMIDTRENQNFSAEEIERAFETKIPSTNPIYLAFEKFAEPKEIIEKIKASDQATLNEIISGRSLVHHAVSYSRIEMLTALLKKDVYVNRKSAMGHTPLFDASTDIVLPVVGIDARKEMITLLVHYGAEIDTRDYVGETPLCFAAEAGNLKIVLLLLSLGANPNFKNGAHMTARHVANRSGHHDVARAIVTFMKSKPKTIGEMFYKATGGNQHDHF